MINNDSIVTAYDEHLTLVEWLQKIEKLLANGGLKTTTLNDKGNATFSLTLTFNDDTTIESPDMTLTSVNEALADLDKYKGINITFPISEMQGVKMGAVSNIDLENDTLPASIHRIITSQEKSDLYTLVLKAVKYGYVIDTQSNNTGTILTLSVCDISANAMYIVFGGKDCNDNLGMSSSITLDSTNQLDITYGEV